MIVLGIDTSCDDTCVAILKIEHPFHGYPKSEILSNIVSSQVKIHAKYGGVWPYLAKREHQRNLPLVFRKALKEAGFEIPNPKSQMGPKRSLGGWWAGWSPKIDLIAITVGPGLEPCLWVGVNFAKDLSKKIERPLIPVNHIEAHIFANFINNLQLTTYNLQLFPAICLVVSGGHTQLILMKNLGDYKIIGETRDDAAGECFDKVARILGLPYPGGPAIAAAAAQFSIFNFQFSIKLPRPMLHQKNYDFSFSGLKTAVLYKVKGERFKVKDKRYVQEMCFEVQQAVIDVLIQKTLRAAKEFKTKSIILGGGVASNEELRKQFKKAIKTQLLNTLYLIPDTSFCTDNAAMVAVAGYFHWLKGERYNLKEIEANANLKIE